MIKKDHVNAWSFFIYNMSKRSGIVLHDLLEFTGNFFHPFVA